MAEARSGGGQDRGSWRGAGRRFPHPACAHAAPTSIRGVTMTNNARRYTLAVVLSGTLVSVAAGCLFAQARTAASIEVSQYCIPQEPAFDAHRFYCRNERTPVSLPELDQIALT